MTTTTTCPSCGTVIPSGHRFCMSCGATISPEVISAPIPTAALIAPAMSIPQVSSPAMPTTLRKAQRFSPAMFGAILLCFILPFATVSCQYMPNSSVTVTGVDLLVGKVVRGENLGYSSDARWAFLAAIIGLGASFIRSPIGSGLAAFMSFGGVIAMVAIQNGFEAARRPYGDTIIVSYHPGYYIVFGLFLAVIVVNTAVLVQQFRPTTVP
ncbi:MAG: zinc ribbon domain-containing protein [Chloroflexia bacterium]|nr:zinc ribbon domain-containing protein [Chloroflexia bacterium]